MVSINNLPPEIMYYILSYLDPISIRNCLLSHKLFHVLTKEEILINQLRCYEIKYNIELINEPSLKETIQDIYKEICSKYATQQPQLSPELRVFLMIGRTIYDYLCRINELLE